MIKSNVKSSPLRGFSSASEETNETPSFSVVELDDDFVIDESESEDSDDSTEGSDESTEGGNEDSITSVKDQNLGDALFGSIDDSGLTDDLPDFSQSFSLPSLTDNSFLSTKSKPQSSSSAEKTEKKESSTLKNDDQPLYEWCENFSFQAGVEYLRLKRAHPTVWEGMTIAGFIQDIYEPIDEQWLAEHWGGGTYRIEAVQLGKDSKSRVKATKICMVSGVPTHFVDDQGKARLLPTTGKFGGRSSDMLIGRNRGVGKFNTSYRDTNADLRPTNEGSASAVELLKLAQASAQEKRDESKSLEILRLAQHDFQNQISETSKIQQNLYKEILDNQRNELERMRTEQERVIEKAQQPLSDALNLVSNRAEKESSILKEQMQRIENEHKDRVNSLRDEINKQYHSFLREKEELKEAHQKYVDILGKEYSERERLLVKEHSERERLMRDNYEHNLNDSREKERVVRESYEKLSSSYQDKIDSNNKFFQDKIDVINKSHQDKINTLMQSIEKREKEFRDREQEIRNSVTSSSSEGYTHLRLQMDTMRDSHNTQINNIQNEHSRKLSELYKEMSSLRDDARNRENDIRREASEREQRLINEHHKNLTDARNDYNDRIEALRREFESREKDKKESFEKLERDIKEASLKTEKELKDALLKTEKEFRTSLSEREKELRENYEKKEENIRDSLEAKYESKIKGLEDRLEFLKSNTDEKSQQFIKDADRRELQLKTMLETNYGSQIKIIEAERDRLKYELETTRSEVDKLRNSISAEKDPISKLAEIKSFKENLRSYGFLPEDEQPTAIAKRPSDDEEYVAKKPEPPKDLIGKLAHYGPSIAQNILAPVLARVDNATTIANEAVGTQRLELENQAKMLDIQRAALESERRSVEEAKEHNYLQEQMNMQRRLEEKKQLLARRRMEREARMEEEQQAAHKQVAVPTNNSVVDEAERPVTIPRQPVRKPIPMVAQQPSTKKELDKAQNESINGEEDMNGYERLADFLNENILEQEDPEAVSNKLKTAALMRLIPKSVLDEAVSQPFENLYNEVAAVAKQKGYSKLSSPRGMNFCQKVYTALKS